MNDPNNEHKELMGKKMFVLCMLLIVMSGCGLLYGLIKIQWIDGDYWRERSQSRKSSEQKDPARRGDIYSSDGKILATALPVCDLYIDLGHRVCTNSDGSVMMDRNNKRVIDTTISDAAYDTNINLICKILHKSKPHRSVEYYKKKIGEERAKATPNQCFLVERNIPYSCWRELKAVAGWRRGILETVNDKNVKHYIRAHTYNNVGGNVIGLENGLTDTYTGLEGYYDSILRGRDGIYTCRRLTKGVWLADESENDIDIDSIPTQHKIDGKSITATIDTRYQDIADASLRAALQKNKADGGCAILMEVETGYVLACSNMCRDSNGEGGYAEVIDRNIACADIYEPGSVFKPVILTSILNDSTKSIDINMRLRARIKNFDGTSDCELVDDHGDKDTLSLTEVIVQSSNVGMSELGWRYYHSDRARLKELVTRTFPTKALMLDLNTSEYHQKISSLRPNRNFLNFCFGYSTTVSPIQLLTFYNAIAGGGRMVKPLFCKQIGAGDEAQTIAPVVLNEHICSKETAQNITNMLIQVVEQGTAKNIYDPKYKIAGKTGTAKIIPQGISPNNATFACFFPADKPKYSCLVLIKHTYASGGKAAAPVAKQIADAVMALDPEIGTVKMNDIQWNTKEEERIPHCKRGYRKDIEEIYATLGIARNHNTDSNSWIHYDKTEEYYTPTTTKVPDCRGMSIKDAIRVIEQSGMRCKFSGCGKVVGQQPAARSVLKKGGTVTLTLSN